MAENKRMNIAVVTSLAVLEGKNAAGRNENQRIKEALERQGRLCAALRGMVPTMNGVK